ncbi:MAG: hypothetical protein IRY99_21905 [Isosphaeraceae bacterium]|nr:hypothetical protein [Isosphaeraceae bacterium]
MSEPQAELAARPRVVPIPERARAWLAPAMGEGRPAVGARPWHHRARLWLKLRLRLWGARVLFRLGWVHGVRLAWAGLRLRLRLGLVRLRCSDRLARAVGRRRPQPVPRPTPAAKATGAGVAAATFHL